MLDLGLYFVFKDKLGLQPSEIEILLGVINFPWVVKMLFGLISDNFTFFGSRRKSYLMTMVSLNLLSLLMLMMFAVKYGKYFITFCIFSTQLCMTYCDAISDALIVQNSKISESAANNLNSLTMFASAFGGILGCSFAALIELVQTKRTTSIIDPNTYFGIYAFLIFVLLVGVVRLNPNLEPEIILKRRAGQVTEPEKPFLKSSWETLKIIG